MMPMIFISEHHNKSGVVEYENGTKIFTMLVQKDGDEWVIRIEDGWYNTYKQDGEAICSGMIIDHKSGVETLVKGESIKRFIATEYRKDWRDI